MWLLCLNGLTTDALSDSAIRRERVKLLRRMAEGFFSDKSEKVIRHAKLHSDPTPKSIAMLPGEINISVGENC
mgnify:CR=1 FL=1